MFDEKLPEQQKNIAYFNSLNAGIEVLKISGKFDRQEIICLRDFFYNEWVKFKTETDKKAKEAQLCKYDLCPKCGKKVSYIPAGISKGSGRPYDEFWSCSDRKCEWTWNLEDKDKKEETIEIPINENK